MTFSKSLIAAAAVCLSLSFQAYAHAGITPALGVPVGAFVRANVQRPKAGAECGTVDIAQTFDSSVAIPVAPNGTFSATITDFNAGLDGSREITQAIVDPTGTGASFPLTADVLVNGDRVPTTVGSQPLVVQLPVGTVCAGGAAGDKCLVSFTTAGNFGNCVVVQQVDE